MAGIPADTGVWLLADMKAGLPAKAKGGTFGGRDLSVATSPGRSHMQYGDGG